MYVRCHCVSRLGHGAAEDDDNEDGVNDHDDDFSDDDNNDSDGGSVVDNDGSLPEHFETPKKRKRGRPRNSSGGTRSVDGDTTWVSEHVFK